MRHVTLFSRPSTLLWAGIRESILEIKRLKRLYGDGKNLLISTRAEPHYHNKKTSKWAWKNTRKIENESRIANC